jgi:transcriptional regulator with XRE-family HTH domain
MRESLVLTATAARHSELRDCLVAWRARIHPRDVGLSDFGRRRVPGLRREEVAELAGVSPRWYELFEAGHSRRVSAEFVQRVAEALLLNERERALLNRLALPEVEAAVEVYERSWRDGALESYVKLRDFARDVSTATSFSEATIKAVEVVHGIIGPDCATVAILESREPELFATGARAKFADHLLARTVLDMNAPTRSGATVMCEHAPDPKQVCDDASHPIRVRDSDGRETVAIHSPAAGAYRDYNSQFRQRSGPAVGIFSQAKFRGLLSCFWAEPRIIHHSRLMLWRLCAPFSNCHRPSQANELP